MAGFIIGPDLYGVFGRHLIMRAEQVGFFLADWQPEERCFALCDWWAVPPEGLEYQSDFHVALTDDIRVGAIKWAWDSGTCLVEAHSHGKWGTAKFSPSDLWGFGEWVPHVWWRLRGRPYAALVTAGDKFDGVAWIDGPKAVEPIESLEIEDGDTLLATGRTLREGVDCDEFDADGKGAELGD